MNKQYTPLEVFNSPLYQCTVDKVAALISAEDYLVNLLVAINSDTLPLLETRNLTGAFYWFGTPQGDDFWYDLHELTEASYETVRKMKALSI